MIGFWIANLAAWSIVMMIAAPGAFVAAVRLKGTVRRGDPMRLGTFLVAFFITAQIVRWLVAPDNVTAWKALYVIGLLAALYIIRLMIAYGRGDAINPHHG